MDVHKACCALKAKERTFKRDLKFRTKKDRTWSIYIESLMLNCKTQKSVLAPIFGTTTDHSVMRTEQPKTLPLVFNSDVRVQYERFAKRYFMCISIPIAKNDDAKTAETQGGHIAAIDPGIRTFATIYDVGRQCTMEWGISGGHKNEVVLGVTSLFLAL